MDVASKCISSNTKLFYSRVNSKNIMNANICISRLVQFFKVKIKENLKKKEIIINKGKLEINCFVRAITKTMDD